MIFGIKWYWWLAIAGGGYYLYKQKTPSPLAQQTAADQIMAAAPMEPYPTDNAGMPDTSFVSAQPLAFERLGPGGINPEVMA